MPGRILVCLAVPPGVRGAAMLQHLPWTRVVSHCSAEKATASTAAAVAAGALAPSWSSRRTAAMSVRASVEKSRSGRSSLRSSAPEGEGVG